MNATNGGSRGTGPAGAKPDKWAGEAGSLERRRVSDSETPEGYGGTMLDPPPAENPQAKESGMLPASLYDRAIDLRYWAVVLLAGAALWAILFKLI